MWVSATKPWSSARQVNLVVEPSQQPQRCFPLEAVICLRITTVRKSSPKALAALLSLFWAQYVGGHCVLCAKGYTWNGIMILRGWNTLSSNGNTVLGGVRTSGIHSLAAEGTVGGAPRWNFSLILVKLSVCFSASSTHRCSHDSLCLSSHAGLKVGAKNLCFFKFLLSDCATTESNVINTNKIRTLKLSLWCDNHDYTALRPLELICRRNVEELVLWVTEALERYKQTLMGDSGGSLGKPEWEQKDRE